MNIDFPTLLGVLGVVLTVVFFVVGYRQTIGARKERARAANKVAAEAVFRRLTLETHFNTDPLGIARLLAGWALDARVRLSDMYTSDDLHAVLLCRIVENDYLAQDQRKEVMHRLSECFKDAGHMANSGEHTSQIRRAGAEILLAATSGMMALVATTITAFLVISKHTSTTLTRPELNAFVGIGLMVVALVFLTTVALFLFTRLRESTRSTNEKEVFGIQNSIVFERELLNNARRANPTVEISNDWPDFTFKEGDKKVAVKIKTKIATMPTQVVQKLVSDSEHICNQDGYSKVIIVTSMPIRQDINIPSTGKVEVVSYSELLRQLRSAAQVV